ncbi:hypothetical protein Sinme_1825 [Sinorhizobium meliloti AK83]|nr:hypothetical protein Sinme_1825 [Sinorhizobium meliloti AK83]
MDPVNVAGIMILLGCDICHDLARGLRSKSGLRCS